MAALSSQAGFRVRAVTRNVSSDLAKALAAKDNVEVVQADLGDKSTLIKVLKPGPWLYPQHAP